MTITTPRNVSATESIVLVRLLVGGEKGETRPKIQKDLEPLLAHRWAGTMLTERIERVLATLESTGLLTIIPGKTKRTAAKYVLTAEGHRRSLEFLGVPQLRPKTTWAVLRKTYLPACVLGIPASTETLFKALASEPAFQAVLLKQQFNLSIGELPKPDEATDSLAWKLIGFEGENRKFNPKNVKTAIFNRALGDGHMTDFKKAAARLLAQRIGARRDDAKELRDAVVRSLIDREENGPIQPAFDLPSFAERVKSVARGCPTGRFGENKVFISHVWKALQFDPKFETMELDTFKEHLAQANNVRLLDLTRADLVQAMDADDIRQSEVHYLNATFHFVRI
jgi:hypothetical protein